MGIRLAAWNLAHQAKATEIPDEVIDVLRDLNPDVIVLTELVPAGDGESLKMRLAKLDYIGFRMSDYVSGQNRVVIAAKASVESGDFHALDRTPATRPNFLHVQLKEHSLDVIGIRVPMFDGYPGAEKDYWAWLEQQAPQWSSRRLVMIGDLNADPEERTPGGQCLSRLIQSGWTATDPVEPWSYVTGSRLDHALLAPGLYLKGSSFITEWRGRPIVQKVGKRLSDHALLIADVEC